MKISLWHEIFSLNTDLAMPFYKLNRKEMFIKRIAIFIEVYMS